MGSQQCNYQAYGQADDGAMVDRSVDKVRRMQRQASGAFFGVLEHVRKVNVARTA